MPPNYRRIDWANPENNDRLVAAVLAAQGMKIDYKLVAQFFGHGATYSSILGRCSKIKEIALKLADDNEDEETARSATPTPSAKSTASPLKPKIELTKKDHGGEKGGPDEGSAPVAGGDKVVGGRIRKRKPKVAAVALQAAINEEECMDIKLTIPNKMPKVKLAELMDGRGGFQLDEAGYGFQEWIPGHGEAA